MADDFEAVKREVAEEQRLLDQAQGSYNHQRKFLRKTFGVKTLKEAEALAAKLLEEVQDYADEYLRRMQEYKRLRKKAQKARKK